MLAVCLCLITYCKNLALDNRLTETIVPGAIINVKRKYFHWWPIFSFSGIHVRQILHTKMVNFNTPPVLNYVEDQPNNKISNLKLSSQMLGPLYFVYEMLCRVS